ncbi:hypothetical protein [Antarcticirhabdus aurantiaca]|uniref:Uncharacterized protein n=1 Tax=Antarcticirhabdus aurantiaca TaxID=2606717 RepID=A0ACD4NK77_9HYPH|nr:hypothetical protein [Antarcticirhabdus aurantiaca]WAJ27137.1 hypothetical protein OXU80_20105 [Jeongeuplla avenae]
MAGVDLRNVTLPIGLLRHALFDDLGPAWLRLDGKTEYQRAMYPDFVAKAAGMSWFLAGSTSAKFKLVKVPAGYATVASGFDGAAGTLIGSDSVTLLAAHLPEHAHDYQDNQASVKPNVSGLLASLLTTSPGIVTADVKRTTAKAGSAAPTPVPIKPPGFVAHLFVFAGRPRG